MTRKARTSATLLALLNSALSGGGREQIRGSGAELAALPLLDVLLVHRDVVSRLPWRP